MTIKPVNYGNNNVRRIRQLARQRIVRRRDSSNRRECLCAECA
jgi:hypothetical protein